MLYIRIIFFSLLLLLILNPLNAGSKDNYITFEWVDPILKLDTAGKERKALHFKEAITDSMLLPQAVITVKGNVVNFSISGSSVIALTQAEAGLIPSVYSEAEFPVHIKYGKMAGEIYSFIYLTPLRFSNSKGTFEKLVSCTYELKFSSEIPESLKPANDYTSGAGMRIASANSFTTNSVLVNGSWYKFSINESGIHKIDYNLLQSFGIDPSSIDPRNIKIFGNGGGMLPQLNSAPREDDLVENAVMVVGEEDGRFDRGDYILFYAKGPHTWKYNASQALFNHSYNIYSEQAFYFLTIGPGPGQRVQTRPSLAVASQSVNTFNDFVFYEKEEINILQSGKEWFGEKFDYTTLSRSFSFSLPGLVSGTNLSLTASVMSASTVNTSFNVRLNNNFLGDIPIGGISNYLTYTYSTKGVIQRRTFTANTNNLSGSSLFVTLEYNPGGTSISSGYLNFLEINCLRSLQLYGQQTAFRSIESLTAPTTEYLVSNVTASATIWDITDPIRVEAQAYNLIGNTASFVSSSDKLREFIVFSGNSFPQPVFAGTVPNQNLHSINNPVPDLIIVSSPEFLSAAERLASHRRSYNGYRVAVVSTEQIYNEFSSGAQDITAIRDFTRMVYQRATPQNPLRYLLLFGDCSYDYKNRSGLKGSFIPVYESIQSLNPVSTYSSDDYFGFLDEAEGEWKEPDPVEHLMDIGVGRLPVNNPSEADQVVNKIIHYDASKETRGKWRNKITFVADDGDNNTHQIDAEKLSLKVQLNAPVFNISKIYLDAFPQIAGPSGEIAQAAKTLLNQEVEKGVLVVNYTGHGGMNGWTQERVLEVNDIMDWKNMDRLTFMVTATCEFGRYDDPARPSGAEIAFRKPDGGAIALMTTTRPVYSSSNFKINNALYNYIFTKNNGDWPTLGEIMKNTKNTSIDFVNNRNYSLLGDPSQKLAYAEKEIVITAVNGKDPALEADTLKALSKATIEGEVRSGGVVDNDFTGILYSTVFDKSSEVLTLGNEWNSAPMTFKSFNNIIYDGKASVKNGKFTFSFVVPKDISYQFDPGKISLYAVKHSSITDAHGYDNSVYVGGSADSISPDNTPPRIKVYINDESFVNGGVTGRNPILNVKLFDENGINIAGTGIGHEITAAINNSDQVIILNDYYSAKLDDYTEGSIEYPLKDLVPGTYSLKVKAWDTHNNSAEGVVEFVVINDEEIGIRNVLNYPNPFSTNTSFHFDHNRTGDDIQVMVQIFTVSGKLVKTLSETFYLSKSHIAGMNWDGRDDFGDKIGKGVYVYKLEVKSLTDGSKSSKYQKLVLLN